MRIFITGEKGFIGRNLVERIKERIESGEVISFREINYTVAVEPAASEEKRCGLKINISGMKLEMQLTIPYLYQKKLMRYKTGMEQ